MFRLNLVEDLHYKKIDHPVYKYEMIMDLSTNVCYKVLKNLNIEHEFFSLKDGTLTAKKGYRWDGPSGPTIDDETNMRASLFHDIGYQIFDLLGKTSWWLKFKIRRAWDKLFKKILKSDGMSLLRRTKYYIAVRGVGAFFAYI